MEQSIDATRTANTSPPAVEKAQHKILFLAANPTGTNADTLAQEARAIQEELERCGHRERFSLVMRWAVQPLDLLRELRKVKPTIVHFSGQGAGGATAVEEVHQDGLCFEGDDGHAQLISAEALRETFEAAGSSVKLIVLNACYSDVRAEALVGHVACVVGVAGPILDDSARYFAVGLYGGLGECESVATAFRQGLAAIRLKGIKQLDSNVRLLATPGIDPGAVYIVDARQQKRRCSIVIKATLSEFDSETITRVRDYLRLVTQDMSLQITDVQEGSVRLEISLSSEAAERLRELSESNEITHILGFEVSSINMKEASAAEESFAIARTERFTVEDEKGLENANRAHRESADVDPGDGLLHSQHGRHAGEFQGLPVESPDLAKSTVRLALADHHAIVRRALREAVSKADDIEVVGEAGTAAETLEMITRVRADMLILDMNLPDRSGFDVLSEMRGLDTAPLVIVLTWHTELSYAARAIAAGAHGYVNKAVELDELLAAIRAVGRGEQVIPPGVEELLRTGDGPTSALTAREQQVMALLSRGLARREIAECLGISISTVTILCVRALKKLRLRSSSELSRLEQLPMQLKPLRNR